jgi:hypothetical protein
MAWGMLYIFSHSTEAGTTFSAGILAKQQMIAVVLETLNVRFLQVGGWLVASDTEKKETSKLLTQEKRIPVSGYSKLGDYKVRAVAVLA